ncbi:MAG TPA: glycosyltransferase family A protein [Candidatus Polarisedimenticolaceae bacterium]
MNGAPRFSVLVPTRGRPDLAAACVASVLAQDHPSFELVLSDQSDDDRTFAAATAAAAGNPRLTIVRAPGRGRSRALNAGLPACRGAWIVMTDDDCEPEPGWLLALDREAARAPERAAIVGRVVPGPVEPGKADPPATLDEPEPRDWRGRVDRDLVYPNFAIPRAAFAELGRFDVRLGVGTPIPGGEDNDFGYRLLRSGYALLYRPGPTVVHRAWRSHEERLALKRAYGVGQGGFYAKHLARGDAFVAWRLARDLFRNARAAGGAAIRGNRTGARGHLAYLSGLGTGLWRMGILLARRAPAEDR